MKRLTPFLAALTLILTRFISHAEPLPKLSMVPAFPHLQFRRPLQMVELPDGSNRWCLIEQTGRIFIFPKDRETTQKTLLLDLHEKVYKENNEEGLLSIAFDPDFKSNGFFYLYHTVKEPLQNRIVRYYIHPDKPDQADPHSEKLILEIQKPYGNHNGSTLLFGPDGYLYFSVGDGGAGGDPHDNGQNLQSLLGKIHRIDVHPKNDSRAYGIPSDNPFVGREDARLEVWAYGLRNVWRMSFDRSTGDLWAGDVGQGSWEEIDLIVKGGNYGWKIREGFHPFQPKKKKSESSFIDPITEYGREKGSSVTGGYVYRGKQIQGLYGAYLYADFTLGTIFGLRYENSRVTEQDILLSQPKNILSFAEDSDGELYVLVDGGKVFKLEGFKEGTPQTEDQGTD